MACPAGCAFSRDSGARRHWSTPSMRAGDAGVAATNDDAQLSKLSCVRLGYFQDPFVHHFVRHPVKRPPLINRGYYARYAALRDLLLRFLDAARGRGQVLSLGAGHDTAFFQLAAEGRRPAKYVELDFPEVTARKAAAIAAVPELRACVGADAALDAEAGSVLGGRYALLPADLREPAALEAALRAARLDHGAPTFVLAECVLVYMEPAESSALVAALGRLLRQAVCAVYEQVNPGDAFGRTMLANLEARGCPLRGLAGTPTLAAHAARFTAAGWPRARARSMRDVYASCLEPAARRRAERLELFDELEEWHLMQEHYCITLASKGSEPWIQEFTFPSYGAQQLPPPAPLPPNR